MKYIKALKAAVAALAVTAFAGGTAAQTFPSRHVKIITLRPPASSLPVVLRVVNEHLSRTWGHPVLFDDGPKGNGLIAFQAAKNSSADGYTVLQADNLQLAAPLCEATTAQMRYIPFKETSRIAMVASHRTPVAIINRVNEDMT